MTGILTPPLLGATGKMGLTMTEWDSETKQEPDKTGFICLFKNRILFYVQICTYLHKMYKHGPQVFGPHTQSPVWAGWGTEGTLSFGLEISEFQAKQDLGTISGDTG